jgi:hypothetical protein
VAPSKNAAAATPATVPKNFELICRLPLIVLNRSCYLRRAALPDFVQEG